MDAKVFTLRKGFKDGIAIRIFFCLVKRWSEMAAFFYAL